MKRLSSEKQLAALELARINITADSYQRAVIKRDRPLAERLAKFRVVNGEDDCWGWNGATDPRGYGKLGINKKTRIATHIALEVDGRPRPSNNHCACHKCDNPECTNPRHLWWGSRSENTRDMIAKRRHGNAKSGQQ